MNCLAFVEPVVIPFASYCGMILYVTVSRQDTNLKHMAQTVIGIFDYNSQAETAIEMLVAKGFNREKIDIATQEQTAGRGDVTDEVNTLNSSIGRFFQRVLEDADQALKYAAVAQQGAVVAVQSDDYSESLIAADLLDACGAINVDERTRMLEDSWTRDERTGGYSKKEEGQTPEIKVFPAIAEHEQPTTIRSEESTAIQPEQRESVRIKSRIIERPVSYGTPARDENGPVRVTHSNTEDTSISG